MYGQKAGIFGVLADKTPGISFYNASALDSRRIQHFPSFVLAHSMDLYHNTRRNLYLEQFEGGRDRKARTTRHFYQDLVTEENDQNLWKRLVEMGRPQWENLNVAKQALIQFAEDQLLSGLDSTSMASFQLSTLFGAASMLYRLGLRPLSSALFSLDAVANFMAVLEYVSRSHDQYVSDYTSDPFSAFGAARLWYDPHPNCPFSRDDFCRTQNSARS